MNTFAFTRKFKSSLLFVAALAFLTPLPAFAQGKPEIYISRGHSSSLSSVAISPNGRFLASGSQDNTIKIWDIALGLEFNTLKGHLDGVNSVMFSPDGLILASGSTDQTIKLWNIASGIELKTLRGHDLPVISVAFSPDGTKLVSGASDNNIKVWDVVSGAELKTLKGHSKEITSVRFSPDGRVIASASADNTIKLWDSASGVEIKTLSNHSKPVRSIDFSPDGMTIASASDDNSVKLWSVHTGSVLKTLLGHSRQVESVAFSPDGKLLASGSADLTIELWDVASGTAFKALRDNESGSILAVVFSPDGKIIAGCGEKIVRFWDVASGSEVKTFRGHSEGVMSVAFSPDGKTLAVGNLTKSIKLWDVAAGGEPETLGGLGDFGLSVAFSRDGRMVASASGRAIKVWDMATRAELKTFKGHSLPVTSVAFSPNGKVLASISFDHVIKLWNIASGEEFRRLEDRTDKEGDTVRGILRGSIEFSADGKTLVTGGGGKIHLWDVASGTELKTLKNGSGFTSFALSPDGKTLAGGGSDSSISVWDISSATEVKVLSKGSSPVVSLAFSPDGKTLASGDTGNTIQFWNLALGSELAAVRSHSSGLNSLAFSPDGKTLASGSADGTTKLWTVPTGVELASLIALDERDWVVVTPDGRFAGSNKGISLISYKQDNKLLPLDSFFERFYNANLLQEVYERKEVKHPVVKHPIAKIGTFPNNNRRLERNKPLVDFTKAVRLPPSVRIVSPTPGSEANSDTAQIVIRTDDQGGGVEDIRLYQNGKLLDEPTRQLTRESKENTRTFEVNLLPGVNTFRATAFNNDRTEAVPDEIKIELKALEATANLYILAIGLNKYKNENYDLNYGRADAQAFADAVEARGKGIFKQITKKVLFDADASRGGIEKAFSEIIKQAKPQDAFVFYYAGHGAMSEDEDKAPSDFYLVPYDVVKIFGDSGSLTSLGISARQLRETLRNVRAQKQLIVLDACQSGGAVETIAMRGPAEEKAIMQLSRSVGVTVLASAGQDQSATEFSKLGHGVFTYALLKGLNGEADGAPKDGKVTVRELEAYISDQVPELTKLYRGKRQDPNSSTRGQDFPIGIR